MAARTTTSTRWVIAIMVVALLASVLVVVGLIQITGEGPTSSASSSESAGPASGSAPRASTGVTTPTASSESSASPGRSVATTPTTTPVQLDGSGLALPAGWTGTADMTITVQGRCAATGGTSFYTRPAQFALQVAAVPTAAATTTETGQGSPGTAGPSGTAAPASPEPTPSSPVVPPPGQVSMTLGITPTGVPGLAIYSTSSNRAGTQRQTWVVNTQADPTDPARTLISASLVDDQPVGGAVPPNLLVDSETDLQPCETGSGVRLPRPLAKGATITGWVSATEAALEVRATTTDGERAVQATLTLSRNPGP